MPANDQIPNVPKPTIYLRNRLRVKSGHLQEFFAQKARFLKEVKRLPPATTGTWNLVAAFAEDPLVDIPRPNATVGVTQIWKLGLWNTLFDSIYAFSESDWYRALGATIAEEGQELLVNLTSGNDTRPRSPWPGDQPNHAYLYEEAVAEVGDLHSYLRDLNWFAAQVASDGWKRVWVASQITARPAVMCVLWEVPKSANVQATLARVAAGKDTRQRYQKMMSLLGEVTRVPGTPTLTERYDDLENAHPTPQLALAAAAARP